MTTPMTYRDYLSHSATIIQKSSDADMQNIWNKSFKISDTYALPFLLDFSDKSYPYIGSNTAEIMGHDRGNFCEGGLEFMLYNFHDFSILNSHIFPQELTFIKSISPDDISQYRFSKTYRYKDRKGNLKMILQRNSVFLSNANQMPAAICGLAFDVTSLVEKGKISHLIERFDEQAQSWTLVYSREYYPDCDPKHLLSKSEINILRLTAEGLRSKEIADKLFISCHTVNTHRRNMLKKTNSGNLIELFRFAIENHLL